LNYKKNVSLDFKNTATVKSLLLKFYNYPLLSKEKTNENQKRIRDVEWEAVLPYVKPGKFLDVGCGAGYAMQRASQDKGCEVFGIDPEPMSHGVGRQGSNFEVKAGHIQKAFAEFIPFDSSMFDTVYSSHVLEHVNDELKSLQEMNRVMKDDAVLIIGMPTASMAAINWISNIMFTTHHRFVNFFFSPFINAGKTTFSELFIPRSHSKEGSTLLFDLKAYKVKRWQQAVSQVFEVQEVLLPALYPYPEMRQWFSMKKSARFSSSVFFVCKKKK
jgi:ubiquinone/menaquinone biosynthesis C-methylase UbiE